MKQLLYSLRDNKVSAFSPPMAVIADIDARRELYSGTYNQNTKMSQFPQDFDLYLVGVFDTDSGEIISQKPEFVVNALENKNMFDSLKRDILLAQENLKKGHKS